MFAVLGHTCAVWPDSPSVGWASGVASLTGLPNGSPFVLAGPTGQAQAQVQGQGRGAGVVTRTTCGGGACTVISGIDYEHGFKGKAPKASSVEECCALCVADEVRVLRALHR